MAKTRRLQVLIEDDQWVRLEREASRRGSSVAAVVREAIEADLPGGDRRRRASAATILGAGRMAVPDVGELLTELVGLRSRRASG